MPEQNQQPTVNPPRPPSGLSKLPRWAWWLVISLTLIAVFGAGFQAWIQQWRANIRIEIPAHKPVSDNCVQLPKEIMENDAFKVWQQKHDLANGIFCGGPAENLIFDTQSSLDPNAASECQKDVQIYGGGKFLPSADGQKSVCMGNFGEPDSDVWLYDQQSAKESRVKFCGTPCTFENGFWIGGDQFVLLQTYADNPDEFEYSAEKFDFQAQTKQKWIYQYQTSNWQIYRNEVYGFTVQYPPDWIEPDRVVGDTSFAVGYGPDSGHAYWITSDYISQSQLSSMGISYCSAYPAGSTRCERRNIGGTDSTIDWGVSIATSGAESQIRAVAWIPDARGGVIVFNLQPVTSQSRKTFDKILPTFKFISASTSNKTQLLRVCPDKWIQDEMPLRVVGSEENRQYYILNGERRELSEFDNEWVRVNCNLKKEIVE